MDAHRGITIRRGCRWTGCRGAPGLGASLAAGSRQPGPCSSTRSPSFTPKRGSHTPGVDAWSRRGAAASLRHTQGRGRPWGWGVCVPQCAPSVPAPCLLRARSVPSLRVGVRHPRVWAGGRRTPSVPLCLPGLWRGAKRVLPCCRAGPRSLINSTLMSDMRLCWEGFAGLHFSSRLRREALSPCPPPPLLEPVDDFGWKGRQHPGAAQSHASIPLSPAPDFFPFFSSSCC